MSDPPKGLSGKVALVAGGYGGIGEACAKALVQEGAIVVVAGRDASKAEQAAQALGAASGIGFDMRDVASMRAAVEQAAARHGGIDLLVNCAGTQQIQPLTEVTEE